MARTSRRTAGKPTDWAELHRRLARVRESLSRAREIPAEQRAAILRQRAALVAAEPDANGASQAAIDVVEFRLAHESYAVECSFVREVAELRAYASLPHTPAFLLGVGNLRGRMVSIVDLRRLFDLPDGGLTDSNRLVVLERGAMEFALLADEVRSVTRFPIDRIAERLPTLSGLRAAFCRGILPNGLILLDAARLLDEKSLIVGSKDPGST